MEKKHNNIIRIYSIELKTFLNGKFEYHFLGMKIDECVSTSTSRFSDHCKKCFFPSPTWDLIIHPFCGPTSSLAHLLVISSDIIY